MGTRVTRPSEAHAKCLQRYAVTRDGMFHRAKRFNSRSLDAQSIFCREFRIKLSVENFNVRKFPKMRVHNAGGALADKKTPVSLCHKGYKVARCGGLTFPKVRQRIHAIFLEGDAEFFNRAKQALRIPRRANQSAEFHEGLVEEGAIRIFGGARVSRALIFFDLGSTESRPTRKNHKLLRQLPELHTCFPLFRIFPDAENPRQHADDIAVENRHRLVEGNAA